MSFGWRGVHGWGRPGGGGDEWIKMRTECASTTTADLAARSEAAGAYLKAIQFIEGNVVHNIPFCTSMISIIFWVQGF